MKHRQLYICLFCSLFLTSCIGSAVYEKELVAGYELLAIDDMSGMCIAATIGKYRVGVVDNTVFSVGFNQNFIIAKQHPFVNNSVNKSLTNYYIIPINNKVNVSPDENKIGLLTQEEFFIKKMS